MLSPPRVPFIGVLHTFLDGAEGAAARDRALGGGRPITQARFARGELPRGAYPAAPPRLIMAALRLLISGLLRGKHSPSPVFDDATGQRIAEPTIVPSAEVEAVRAKLGFSS